MQLDRGALQRHADVRCNERDDLRQLREAPARVSHVVRAEGDREPVRSVDEAPRVTGRDPAQRLRDALGDGRRLWKKQRPRRLGGGSCNRFEDARLGLLPDPGRRAQPSLRCRRPKLVDRGDAERPPDLGQPAGTDAQ